MEDTSGGPLACGLELPLFPLRACFSPQQPGCAPSFLLPRRRHFPLPIQTLSVPRAWLLPGANLVAGLLSAPALRCGSRAVHPVSRYAYVNGALPHSPPSAPCSRVVHKLDLHSGGPLGDMVTEAGKGGWRGREDHKAEDSDLCCKYSWVTQPWGDSEHSQECWLLRSPLEIWAPEGTAIRIPSLLNAPLPGSQLGMGPVTFSP